HPRSLVGEGTMGGAASVATLTRLVHASQPGESDMRTILLGLAALAALSAVSEVLAEPGCLCTPELRATRCVPDARFCGQDTRCWGSCELQPKRAPKLAKKPRQ